MNIILKQQTNLIIFLMYDLTTIKWWFEASLKKKKHLNGHI